MRLSDEKIKRYFDFVTEATIDKLVFILKREKVAIENLAVLVPCLPPHLAAKVLDELDPGSRASIALNMVEPKMFNKALIEKFEAQLKSAMECLIGGESLTQATLANLSEGDRKQILATLQQNNPDGYRRLRPLVVIFDDIAKLDDLEIKAVIDSVGRDALFTALAGASQDTVSRFTQNLGQAQRNMFKEFMDLRLSTLHPTAIESAKDQLLETVLQLEADGKIVLRSKL
jgi:flagellar motor switch protein FliG